MNQQVSIPELIGQQETFFNNALTTEEVCWAKESQYAIQQMQNNEYLTRVGINNQSSLQNAIINVAAIGISLNPALKHAYLVPRAPQQGAPQAVCLDISYRGLIHLALASGVIEWVQSKLVYQNDKYQNNGLDKMPTHIQSTFGDKGLVIGVYCTAKLRAGDYITEEMDMAAIQKVQSTSKAKKGPWVNWWEEMARKTVVKRGSKYWPQADRLNEAITVLNEHEGLEDAQEKDMGKATLVHEFVNQEQIQHLTGAITAAGMTVEQFCSHKSIRANSLNEFHAARFEGAISWLQSQAMGEAG
jgi:recombination protein RecT